MSTIRTKITAAALATVTALGLAACGDSDTPDAPRHLRPSTSPRPTPPHPWMTVLS